MLSLKNLEYLKIYANTSNSDETMITGLNNMANLKQLFFSNKSNPDIQNLEKHLIEIAKCTQLEETSLELNVSNNFITAQDLHRLY